MASNTNTNPASGAAPSAAQDVKAAGLEGYGQTENLRTGINNFFDNTLQPSAARDASAGSTSAHKPGTAAEPTQNAYTQATSTTGSKGQQGGHGFSSDAKKIGSDIMNAVSGSRDTNAPGSTSTVGNSNLR